VYLGRMGAASGDVFPRGVIVLEVQPAMAFNDQGQREEGQATDDKTGLGIWMLTGIDVQGLDPDERAKGFRGSPEVKVRILSTTEPEIPRPQSGGLGSVVEFVGLMVTPYMDADRCNGQSQRCRSQLKYSFRATAIKPFKN